MPLHLVALFFIWSVITPFLVPARADDRNYENFELDIVIWKMRGCVITYFGHSMFSNECYKNKLASTGLGWTTQGLGWTTHGGKYFARCRGGARQLCSYVYILTFNNKICVRQTDRHRNSDTGDLTPVTTPHVLRIIPHNRSFNTRFQI